jgi:hypothetical protein
LEMSRRKRLARTTIFIACEGRNTEPIYFERIKEDVEEANLLSIEIYPDRKNESPKTDALGLVREAKSRLEYFDEVWVVFDKNGYTKHKEAFDEAKEKINGKQINIAFSSISFEHWILLHFEKNTSTYLKSANIIDEKFTSNETYFSGYNKHPDIDIYPKIKDQTLSALENASWLRHKQKAKIHQTPIYEINPYTDVDILVKRLLDLEKIIIWANLKENIRIGKAELFIDISDGVLRTTISNKNSITLISTECVFSTISLEQSVKFCPIEKRTIEPDRKEEFYISDNSDNLVILKINFSNIICFVELSS